ncbi:sterile alpha motif domain-containing protein aveugle isoform X2 [Tachypleus tridentatus]|uniref:sterile alpha motif domain-containing protein aveugle isoform X2 n=1 Tax=Tachypleus tridentatus TaxID=6853 RepID=UPI003FD0B320
MKEDSSTNRSKGPSSPTRDKDAQKESRNRPKAVFFWTNADVMKWLRRQCQEYHSLYSHLFLEHDITGRSLVRIRDTTLESMGISNKEHRDDLCRKILKLKLKSDILEMKDLERKELQACCKSTVSLSSFDRNLSSRFMTIRKHCVVC